MRKHRLRDRIKSLVGNHVDPDKDEELIGSNIETEDNYKKILELLKEENQEDNNKLIGLIEEFHKRYQSIYDRYDNITGKLKKKVHSEKETNSSSSSSSKNGKLTVTDSLNEELQAANKEIEDLKIKLSIETEQKEAASAESERLVNESQLQSDRLHQENTKLRNDIRDLNLKLENSRLVETDLNQKLRDVLVQMKGEKEVIQTLEIAESENKSLSEKVSELSEKIRTDHQIIEDLKSDLEIKEDEITTLTENVRNLEVKLRLANQKLHVTEQMLNESEHDHATKEEKLHQENKSLIDKISDLSQTIATIKTDIHDKLQETLAGFDSLTGKFEEHYRHVTIRVHDLTNEVQSAQIKAKQSCSEKEEFKQKHEETVTKLKMAEGENDGLMKSLENIETTVVGKDEKIKELENVIRVKDDGILDVGEDKREAIRQLSKWADYQRDRCNHLQELLLKTTTGGRRQTMR